MSSGSFRSRLSSLLSRKSASASTDSNPPPSTSSQVETAETATLAPRDLRQDAWDTVRKALSEFADAVQKDDPELDVSPLRNVSV